MWSLSVIVEAPIDVLLVHLLFPEVKSALGNVVIKVAILDENLALGIVVVWCGVHLAPVLLLCHSSLPRGEEVNQRIRLKKPVKADNSLDLVAGAHLLKDGLTAKAIAD